MDYSIKINEFEGPLDLLLHLIKEANIDIQDISINEITNQYLDYINKMEELNINVASSYLVMASELMEIKSKSLLPKQEKEDNDLEEEEVSREALINKLIEYKKYKEIIEVFKILESKRKDIYIKGPEKISNYITGPVLNNEGYTVDDLTGAFLNFLKRKEQDKPINTKIVDKEYSVKERKQNIRSILHQKHKVKFQELFNEYNRPYLIVTFLSVLEMTKDKEIIIRQERNFDDILIEEVV